MKTLGVLIWLGLAGLLLVTGCTSSKPGGTSHAAVEIKGHSIADIQAATVVVFAEQGYRLRTNTPTSMVFDRPASNGQKFKYGDWMNDGMVMQIKVRFQGMTAESCLLRADVYAVQDPTDSYFREEKRLTLWNAQPYRKLLDDVRLRLENPSPH